SASTSSRGVPEKTLNCPRDDNSSRKRLRAIAAARIVRVGTSVASSERGFVCMNQGTPSPFAKELARGSKCSCRAGLNLPRVRGKRISSMKGSVLTGKTWLLLIAAALLIAAGALNFSQRLRHRPPPWDGVTWVDSAQGVIAKTIEPGSAAARARLIPGDHLLAVSPSGRRCAEITSGPSCEQIGSAR